MEIHNLIIRRRCKILAVTVVADGTDISNPGVQGSGMVILAMAGFAVYR
jgi:hypothetical protein